MLFYETMDILLLCKDKDIGLFHTCFSVHDARLVSIAKSQFTKILTRYQNGGHKSIFG